MNDRERWVRSMHFQSVDHVPDEEFGYWTDTFKVWHAQGMPAWVDSNRVGDAYFGFAKRVVAPVSLGLRPGFRQHTIEETESHRIIIDKSGIKCRVNRDDSSCIPQFIKFPVESRADWDRFKERLNPATPGRYPDNWEELKGQWAARDYPLGISFGSLFGWLRNWMGMENIAVMFYDDPDLIDDMMEHVTNFIIATITPALQQVQFDFAAGWEDMCYKGGPIISPAMFKKYMVPRYQRITSLLKKHGIDVVYTDCDGDINQLVGLWLEGGVNCMFPLEIRGGSDPYPMREKYGRDLLLLGGVDKTALIAGKESIRAEVKRLEKLVAEGGYIPHVDHRCPPDVTYENYLYYLECKRSAFGMPQPPRRSRREALALLDELGVRRSRKAAAPGQEGKW
jgi:hypothetical protein